MRTKQTDGCTSRRYFRSAPSGWRVIGSSSCQAEDGGGQSSVEDGHVGRDAHDSKIPAVMCTNQMRADRRFGEALLRSRIVYGHRASALNAARPRTVPQRVQLWHELYVATSR